MTFNTDKDYVHGYLPDYTQLAASVKADNPVVCEVGVWQGGSLDMWAALLPGALVIGVDRDGSCRWPEGARRVIADQADPQLGDKVREHAPGGCDLIVDDASHIGRLSAATFTSLWPVVKPGGFYVVEDWADPWVDPLWGVADPSDRLLDWVPELITMLKDGARSVTYTREGLAIVQKAST